MLGTDLSRLFTCTRHQVPPLAPPNQCPAVWGFLVYRTTYTDQGLWDKYINYITKAVLHEVDLDAHVPEVMLAHKMFYSAATVTPEQLEMGQVIRKHFHLCIKEGPEYDGKSIEEIRNIHFQWIKSLPHEGIWHNADGSHNCADAANYQSRYFSLWPRYCNGVYVDEQVLASFAEAWKKDEYREPGDPESDRQISIPVAVFRACRLKRIHRDRIAWNFGEGGMQYPPPSLEDSDDDEDVGYEEDSDFESVDVDGKPVEARDGLGERLWMYVCASNLAHFYKELLHDAWDRRFRRPPTIWKDEC